MSTEPSRPFKILFLCTGNSARSILAEYLMRKLGGCRFESSRAGANPTGKVNPHALRVLKDAFQIEGAGARSKSGDEFRDVRFDFVVTVFDHAAEVCPVRPGHPIVAHWPVPDPAGLEDTDAETYRHFWQVAQLLFRRQFCNLPFKRLNRRRLKRATRDIARPKNALMISQPL